MNTLAADHFSSLKALADNAGIMPLVKRMETAWHAWHQAYGHWSAAQGSQQGETQRFTEMVGTLTRIMIKKWDVGIQAMFPEGSSDYSGLMPDRRKPFQTGGYESRISALAALSENLAAYPGLAAVKTDVDAFHTALKAARDTQQQKEALVREAAAQLEHQRQHIAGILYRNLAALMDLHYDNTGFVEKYFSLQLIRRYTRHKKTPEGITHTGLVNAGETVCILEGGFLSSDIITLENTGKATLRFYLSDTPAAPANPPRSGIVLQPGEKASHEALSFGPAFLGCLNVVNESVTSIGRWVVEL